LGAPHALKAMIRGDQGLKHQDASGQRAARFSYGKRKGDFKRRQARRSVAQTEFSQYSMKFCRTAIREQLPSGM